MYSWRLLVDHLLTTNGSPVHSAGQEGGRNFQEKIKHNFLSKHLLLPGSSSTSINLSASFAPVLSQLGTYKTLSIINMYLSNGWISFFKLQALLIESFSVGFSNESQVSLCPFFLHTGLSKKDARQLKYLKSIFSLSRLVMFLTLWNGCFFGKPCTSLFYCNFNIIHSLPI